MATDVRLDEGDGTFLVLDARVVKAIGTDFMLDSGSRRRGGGHRRALVHDQNDGLTINFNGDYPGGITLINVAEIIPQNDMFVVRGGISYEVDVPTGAVGQGAIEGEMHRITVNLNELLDAHNTKMNGLRDRIDALEGQVANLAERR